MASAVTSGEASASLRRSVAYAASSRRRVGSGRCDWTETLSFICLHRVHAFPVLRSALRGWSPLFEDRRQVRCSCLRWQRAIGAGLLDTHLFYVFVIKQVLSSAGPMARDVDSLALCMKALLCGHMFSLDPTVPPIPFNTQVCVLKHY